MGSSGAGLRTALDKDAFAPVVAFEWRVERERDLLDSGEGTEVLIYLSIEGFQLLWLITGVVGTDMDDEPVFGFDAEVLVLKIVEALCHQACADEQHDRECGLKDDKRSLDPS